MTPPPRRPAVTAGPPSAEDPIFHGWERFRVDHLLGTGGMGWVYKAHDRTLNRPVAIKILPQVEAENVERFLRGARAQARVEHPNVCHVYETGEVHGYPYIAMRCIDGRPIDEAAGGLALEEKVDLFRRVALGVHAAHRTGLIHRDLKPDNILVESSEAHGLEPFVVDFGIAKDQLAPSLTVSGAMTGTPAYLSPEQAAGKPLDRRSDLYSLGVLLYEILVGQLPFSESNVARLLIRLIRDEAPPPRTVDPTLPKDLDTIVAKCLEKDPRRRYASARELADDLARFLDGEPIQARPTSRLYRWRTLARKHRVATAALAIAASALGVAGVVSLGARWRARELAHLAQRFGRQLEQIESTRRYTALLPDRTVGPLRRQLRQRMAAIEQEIERLGPAAAGPGNFALGQAHLAFHEVEAARERLLLAWQAGYRTPEVAAAVGRAMGLLYTRTLLETAPAGDAARREIDSAYREPALTYLREAAGSSPPPYLEGQIAFYEQRFDAALDASRRAYGEAPWLYEARQLEAEIHAFQGDIATERGRYEEARERLAEAGRLYEEVIEIARSDAGVRLGECGRRIRLNRLEAGLGQLSGEQLEASLAACDEALAIDRELVDGYHKKAQIYAQWAQLLLRRGEDPSAVVASAVSMTEEALERSAEDSRAWDLRAMSYRLLASWQRSRGEEPAEALRAALAAARRSVELNPSLSRPHQQLGNVLVTAAWVDQERGHDPRPRLELAAVSYRRAIAINPDLFPPFANLAVVWTTLAEEELARGRDPSGSLEQAIDALEGALRINPNSAPIHNNRGNAHLTRAEYLHAKGADPATPLAEAEKAYRRALEVQPDYLMAHFNLALAQRIGAEALADRGEDPTSQLEIARRTLQRAAAVNPNDWEVHLEEARLELAGAEWRLAQGGDPTSVLAAAAAALERSEALNATDPNVYVAWAGLCRRRTEWALSAGAPALPEIVAGLAKADRALDLNPNLAEGLALRGVLLLYRARFEGADEPRRDLAKRATTSLERAFAGNLLLEREYGDLLEQARALAG